MRKLKRILPKKSGRSASGRVTVRHQGGRQKRYLREIDFRREKRDVHARVRAIEYDPNRNADIARLVYDDGDVGYVLAPVGLEAGMRVIASEAASLEVGNALPLSKIPVGTAVHNIEVRPGKGGQVVKSAGSVATIHGRDGRYVMIKLPSGEIRKFDPMCYATVGQVGRAEFKSRRVSKAGVNRRRGKRPTVRGTAQHPGSHPHGGGEGRSGVGMKYPKTPYGRPAVGKSRKRKKYSDSLIVQKRKPGKHSH